jgi:hypothetical protein
VTCPRWVITQQKLEKILAFLASSDNQGQQMEKRPTDLRPLFLLKVLSHRGGTMRFIRWSFFNPLEIF